MKILIAPDSFKGSLTALEVAENIEKGIKKVMSDIEIEKIPMADGGEGTVQSLVDATDGEIIYCDVTGPLGRKVKAYYGLLGDNKTGVIEMATASGLPLISEEEADPRRTTTYGTGELIKSALNRGIKELIIGIGGSATNDAGVGMAQALGIRFLDENNNEIGFGGGELAKIEKINISGLDSRINNTRIRVACDVNNPLYGPEGAAHIYGPQKGATPEIIRELDNNLQHFSEIVKKDLKINIEDLPGAGAAGGLGGGLVAFLNAELESGIQIVLDVNKVDEKMKDVNLVITGEGKIDFQTIKGKTPIGVAKMAKKYKIPVFAIGGMLGKDASLVINEGVDAFFSITPRPATLNQSIQNCPKWLQQTGEQVFRSFISCNNQFK